MHKSFKLLILALTVASTSNLYAADESAFEINPMVLIELTADMKADWVYSEKMMSVEIKSGLISDQKLAKINQDFLRAERAKTISSLSLNSSTTKGIITE